MGRNIITLDDLTTNNVGVFKIINDVSLSTVYPDTWYQSSHDNDHIVQLAFYNELPVGAIRGKIYDTSHNIRTLEAAKSANIAPEKTPDSLYIETLAVLEAYRERGIATELLNWFIAQAKERFVHKVVVHIQPSETKVIEWFLKRGFSQSEETIEDFYKQQGLSDTSAILLTLEF